jgi:hypothetical protein
MIGVSLVPPCEGDRVLPSLTTGDSIEPAAASKKRRKFDRDPATAQRTKNCLTTRYARDAAGVEELHWIRHSARVHPATYIGLDRSPSERALEEMKCFGKSGRIRLRHVRYGAFLWGAQLSGARLGDTVRLTDDQLKNAHLATFSRQERGQVGCNLRPASYQPSTWTRCGLQSISQFRGVGHRLARLPFTAIASALRCRFRRRGVRRALTS